MLELSDVMDKPRLFSTFMLWMLAQLYETLPEAGDLPKPKLCFFFDEAHLLFDDASEALMDQVERTARLIRSKGVGVYFVTQAPTDVPSSVLAQLGNRVQHALRAFTPDDADALRKTARTFPMTEFYDVEKTITSLGHRRGAGDRAVAAGVPTPLAATRLLPPDSLMAPIDEVQFRGRIAASPFQAKYGATVDRESAHERISARLAARGRPPAAAAEAAMRAGVDADDGDRHEHDDAGPAAARDPAPGARDGGRPEGRRARAQGPGEGRARRGRGPSRRSIDNGDPDRRPGRHVAARAGHHPRRSSGRCSAAARAAERAEPPTAGSTDPGWRAEAPAWIDGHPSPREDGASVGPIRSSRAPAVVDRVCRIATRGGPVAGSRRPAPGRPTKGQLLELFRRGA